MSNSGSLMADSAIDGASGNVGMKVPNEGERINRSLVGTEGMSNNLTAVPNSESAQIPTVNNQGKPAKIAFHCIFGLVEPI